MTKSKQMKSFFNSNVLSKFVQLLIPFNEYMQKERKKKNTYENMKKNKNKNKRSKK
jgi:hypothetical protein